MTVHKNACKLVHTTSFGLKSSFKFISGDSPIEEHGIFFRRCEGAFCVPFWVAFVAHVSSEEHYAVPWQFGVSTFWDITGAGSMQPLPTFIQIDRSDEASADGAAEKRSKSLSPFKVSSRWNPFGFTCVWAQFAISRIFRGLWVQQLHRIWDRM